MGLLAPSYGAGVSRSNLSGRPATTQGTSLTASATPHALSATRTEIIASTAFEANWVEVIIKNMAQTVVITDGLLNLYIGGSGSEVLWIDSLSAGWSAQHNTARGWYYWFPIRVPAGTRISGTLRALIASDTCNVEINYGWSNALAWFGSGVETLGENTSLSRGTAVTAGGASEGSWTTIGTSGYRYGYVTLGVQGNNDTSIAGGTLEYDVGTGSAVLQGMERFQVVENTTEFLSNVHDGWWCDIASGTSLQVRAQHSGTTSGNNFVTIHGVY